MSTDPQPFEDDLEAIQAQDLLGEPAEPGPEPGKKKRKKPKRQKVKKARPPRSTSGGSGAFFREQFPDVYTTLLGVAALAIIIAVVLMAIEFYVRYGGERKPTSAMAIPSPAVETASLWVTA